MTREMKYRFLTETLSNKAVNNSSILIILVIISDIQCVNYVFARYNIFHFTSYLRYLSRVASTASFPPTNACFESSLTKRFTLRFTHASPQYRLRPTEEMEVKIERDRERSLIIISV